MRKIQRRRKFCVKTIRKRAASNEQFATSGGATRPDGSSGQQLLALVRTLSIPPPAASCHHVVGKPCGGQSSEL